MQSDLDKSTPSVTPVTGLLFGLALLVVAGVGLLMSSKIQSIGFQDPSDPGPVFFPRTLLSFLGFGGIFETIRHTWRWMNQSQSQANNDALAMNMKYLMVGMGGISALILALPYFGFPLCASLFLVGLSTSLGIQWKPAVIFSLMMTAVIWVIFVWGLQAPLPLGSVW